MLNTFFYKTVTSSFPLELIEQGRGGSAKEFVHSHSSRIPDNTLEDRNKDFFCQRLSMKIRRANAASVCATVASQESSRVVFFTVELVVAVKLNQRLARYSAHFLRKSSHTCDTSYILPICKPHSRRFVWPSIQVSLVSIFLSGYTTLGCVPYSWARHGSNETFQDTVRPANTKFLWLKRWRSILKIASCPHLLNVFSLIASTQRNDGTCNRETKTVVDLEFLLKVWQFDLLHQEATLNSDSFCLVR